MNCIFSKGVCGEEDFSCGGWKKARLPAGRAGILQGQEGRIWFVYGNVFRSVITCWSLKQIATLNPFLLFLTQNLTCLPSIHHSNLACGSVLGGQASYASVIIGKASWFISFSLLNLPNKKSP